MSNVLCCSLHVNFVIILQLLGEIHNVNERKLVNIIIKSVTV